MNKPTEEQTKMGALMEYVEEHPDLSYMLNEGDNSVRAFNPQQGYAAVTTWTFGCVELAWYVLCRVHSHQEVLAFGRKQTEFNEQREQFEREQIAFEIHKHNQAFRAFAIGLLLGALIALVITFALIKG